MTGSDRCCGTGAEHESSRRGFMAGCGAAIALALAGGTGTVGGQEEYEPIGDLLEIVEEENWGRWGEDDELGAINLLGSEEMFAGLTAAKKRGRKRVERFTLQTPITGEAFDAFFDDGVEFPTTDTGDPLFPGRTPARRDNVADVEDPIPTPNGVLFADDRFETPFYLQGTTHYDALGHAWYDGTLYNGFDAGTTRTRRAFDIEVEGVTETFGLGKADVGNVADSGVAGRGVLLDVGRYKVDEAPHRLDLGEEITLEDLEATADAQNVDLRKRDIFLVRTGALERARDPEAEWAPLNEPGLTYSDDLVRWFRDMEFPVVGADNLGVEKASQEVTENDLDDGRTDLRGTYLFPLHGALLRNLGVTINEILDLSDLATQCAADGIYEFLYTAGPLNVEQGAGTPVNPVILKASGGNEGGQAPGRGGNGRGDKGR